MQAFAVSLPVKFQQIEGFAEILIDQNVSDEAPTGKIFQFEIFASSLDIMNGMEIIPLILKYFNFQQLCIAERITMKFQQFVISELHCLTYIDFGSIFMSTTPLICEKIFEKISNYCINLRKADNLQHFAIYLKKKDRLRHIHNIQSLMTHLKIKSYREDPSTIDVHLSLIESSHNLQHIDINLCIGDELLTKKRSEKMRNLFIKHRSFRKLVFRCSNSYWIDLWPSCSNLTHLDIHSFRNWYCDERRQQLLNVLAFSQNMEVLKLSTIQPDEPLIITILQLKCLKILHLTTHCSKSVEYSCNDIKWHKYYKAPLLYKLEEIMISCSGNRSYCDHLPFLLSHCPAVKRFHFSGIEEALYDRVFGSILHPEIVECFTLCPNFSSHITFLKKMPNLLHYHMDHSNVAYDNLICLSRCSKLKCLDINFGYPNYNGRHENLEILLSNRLEALHISFSLRDADDANCATSTIDFILAKCPNLRYVSTTNVPIDHILDLPSKLPELEFLEIRMITTKDSYIIDGDWLIEWLISTIQNLPKLRVIIIPEGQYDALTQISNIVHLSRQGRLLVRSTVTFNDNSRSKWLKICSGSCCTQC